ncbi:BamA/TamA family outer membrane protein [Nibrella saemangeumensis]|uniref:BamA/TamA family outer membrane protein n=1 Tax=Nibrella saemangeumensis TaxID=1084526 RepID=A0ABP8NIJ3_9BACT
MKERYLVALLGLVLGGMLMGGCNVAKHLPANERLYVGTDVYVKGDSSVSADEQKTLKGQLKDMARPRANKTLFGYPYKVALYYLMGEPKRENDFRAWFRKKFGEQPVLASAKAISSNETVMMAFLENEGYFRSEVDGRLEEIKGYQAKAVYDATVRPRYYIDSVGFLIDSSVIRKELATIRDRTLLKKGDPYRFEVIKGEQARISDRLRLRGYYYFQPDYVAVLVDSATGNHRVRMYIALKPDMPAAAEVPYRIRDIYVYPSYSLNRAERDTNQQNAYVHEGIHVVDPNGTYKPELFTDVVGFRSGQVYNNRVQDLTLSRFISLGPYKFVRNRFEPAVQGDSAVLDVHYYLTPYPKKSIRLELAGLTKSNNLAGSQLTLSWRNRNALRRAELLTINGTAGFEVQVGGGVQQPVTNNRFGIEANLTFPRLVSPIRFRFYRRQVLPKTNVQLGYEFISRRTLYNLNSFKGSFGYIWRTSFRMEHTFQPFNVNYVNTSGITDRFIDLLLEADPSTFQQYFNVLTAEQLILSTIYSFNFNSSPRTSTPHTYRLNINLEPAGNLAGLVVRKRDDFGNKELFGVPFYQFFRADFDNRHYFHVTPGLTWASRVFAGVGIPYGNTPYGNAPQLPFIRQYFAGGSTSIRAFRPRAVGPGTYSRNANGQRILLLQDGGGDVKLEFSTELRQRLTQYLQGALFLDVGNVWMYADETTYGPGSKFSKDFYKQLAVGTGVGLRIDLSFFVLRFDLAFPLRKPWLDESQRWVFDEVKPGNKAWRQENLILNVAVGYPF